jgi:hypothetical protein
MSRDEIFETNMIAAQHQRVASFTTGVNYRVMIVEDSVREEVGVRVEMTNQPNVFLYVPSPTPQAHPRRCTCHICTQPLEISDSPVLGILPSPNFQQMSPDWADPPMDDLPNVGTVQTPQ